MEGSLRSHCFINTVIIPQAEEFYGKSDVLFFLPWVRDLLGCSVCVTVMRGWQCRNFTAPSCKPLNEVHQLQGLWQRAPMPRKLQEKADAYIWGICVYIFIFAVFKQIFLLKQLFKNLLSVFLSLCIYLRKLKL